MSRQAMIDVFKKHVDAELAGDLATTMATMSAAPHLTNVPTMVGGVGYEGVRTFYRDHLVGKFFPPDVKMTDVSRTVGENQIVDELVISFTHTTMIDWFLPGVAPTGKSVEVAVAVITSRLGVLVGCRRPANRREATSRRLRLRWRLLALPSNLQSSRRTPTRSKARSSFRPVAAPPATPSTARPPRAKSAPI